MEKQPERGLSEFSHLFFLSEEVDTSVRGLCSSN